MVALGSPVDPLVKLKRATSSRLVLTESNCTGFSKANWSSSALWFEVPSNSFTISLGKSSSQALISSDKRLSHSAKSILAISIYFLSSAARNNGIVFTTTAPTFVAASQQATMAGLFADRINTRLPGLTPKSSTNAWASLFDQSVSSL